MNTVSAFRGGRRTVCAGLLLLSCSVSAQLPVPGGRQPVGASIGTVTDTHMEINQSAHRAIMDWDSFSIGQGRSVHFNQTADQAILNRVVGAARSDILGKLTGGGSVWLINPNGVLIGDGALIETRSFVATTLDFANEQDFLDDYWLLSLQGESEASVVNRGTIRALGGDVALVARRVDNQGLLQADGAVLLGAGDEVELMLASGEYSQGLFVRTHLELDPRGDVGVNHDGIIDAAKVELAAAGGNIYSLAVNVAGGINANGYGQEPGRIYLSTEGGRIEIASGAELAARGGDIVLDTMQYSGEDAGGSIRVAGNLDVSSTTDGGGEIHLHGQEVEVESGAVLNASGATAGWIEVRSLWGEPARLIRIHGGAVLRADGPNGYIQLMADDLDLGGDILMDEGILSLAGHRIGAADARLRVRTLEISGTDVNIAGSGNAIQAVFFGGADYPRGQAEPGDFYLDAGEGALAVGGDPYQFFQYRNVTLLTEGDLTLEQGVGMSARERAVLVSREGGLFNGSALGGELFSEAQQIRLYARLEGELGGWVPDSIRADVLFPADPDPDSRLALYYLGEENNTPEPPAPRPDIEKELAEQQRRDLALLQRQFAKPDPVPPVPPAPPAPSAETGWDGRAADTLAAAGRAVLDENDDEAVQDRIEEILRRQQAQREQAQREQAQREQAQREQARRQLEEAERQRRTGEVMTELQNRRQEQEQRNRQALEDRQDEARRRLIERGGAVPGLERDDLNADDIPDVAGQLINRQRAPATDRLLDSAPSEQGNSPEIDERLARQQEVIRQREEQRRLTEQQAQEERAEAMRELMNQLQDRQQQQQQQNERVREDRSRQAMEQLAQDERFAAALAERQAQQQRFQDDLRSGGMPGVIDAPVNLGAPR